MLNCEDARSLIGRSVDGTIAPRAQDTLDAHLASCPACQEEVDTQRQVHELLAAREPEPLPAGFEARLTARLAHERPPVLQHGNWLDRANWRKWSIYLLPAAAVLVIFATRATVRDARNQPARSSNSQDNLIEWIARPDTTDDSVLVLLVTGDAPSHSHASTPGTPGTSPGKP